ncbi:apses transcription factor-like protein [Lindgomyces ingoldianus]|uniref:Apses transcription factor-like protein n=1 Tax=Lindgomyces ingoldianus TaxID=673940 RepID=A0ACB6R3W2_9PLEO|nr:apses transcription factor-like protein [Lindgomyces ingoldianus]KAF2473866.1 apses transcription factor-like protein [Lindgomyces ingoldianus]
MVAKRALPEKTNGLLEPEHSPPYESLVDRRRLGQTNLAVKPGIVGVTNASRAENLGTFDYAHLRVPLPKDLAGSGIFTLKTATSYPESYFLMRRSSDGYISATGMFKAAFPWASLTEEESERRYQKTFPSAGPDEVAGSVWVAPEEALQLSEEYGMRPWIEALLDPRPIEKGTKDRHNTHIAMPPRFDIHKVTIAPVVLPPTSALRPTRARSSRSASPSKIATPSRKMASPRKSRATRNSAKPEALKTEDVFETIKVIENGTGVSESVASESLNGEVKEADSIHIEVQETVEQNGDVDTVSTKVQVDLPASSAELPALENPEKLIEEATKMVEEAQKLEGVAVNGVKSSKRKIEELSKGEDDDAEASEERPTKQAKTVPNPTQQLKKEKATRRALVGLGVMTAVGAAVQYFMTA